MLAAWARRHDPDLSILRRAVRTTLAACAGFFVALYGLDNRVMAIYALFTAISVGVLGHASGPIRTRVGTLLAVLPLGAALITLGTYLARSTWQAALGLLVVGFVIAFGGVGGPRWAGLANGIQLLYVLACFPPYAPGTLDARLAGLGLGIALFIAADALVLPDPNPRDYPTRLAGAAEAVSALLRARAAAMEGGTPSDLDARRAAAFDAVEMIRPSKVGPGVVPAGPGRRDRALMHAAAALRHVLGRSDLSGLRTTASPEAAAEVRRAGAGVAEAARALRGGPPPPARPLLPPAKTAPGAGRERMAAAGVARSLDEGVRIFEGAVRVARGAPAPEGFPTDPFWYARRSAPALWWSRFRTHLTPRSVYFQSALRLAVALALGRVIAGILDLQNGFWVVLATLTVMRTSAASTRGAVVPAIVGTALGAAVAVPILIALAGSQNSLAALTPFVMVAAFGGTVLFGQLVGQGLFTVAVAVIFAQLNPSTWRLAEIRLLDVALGVVVGVLIGLAAWPHGAGAEVRKAVAELFTTGGRAVRETVESLDGGEPASTPAALPEAQRAVQLADAAFAMVQSERRPRGMASIDWQAAMVAGHDLVRGAQLMRESLPVAGASAASGEDGAPAASGEDGASAVSGPGGASTVSGPGGTSAVSSPDGLAGAARGVESAYRRAAEVVRTGQGDFEIPAVRIDVPPGATGSRAEVLVAVGVYLEALSIDLSRLSGNEPGPAGGRSEPARPTGLDPGTPRRPYEE